MPRLGPSEKDSERDEKKGEHVHAPESTGFDTNVVAVPCERSVTSFPFSVTDACGARISASHLKLRSESAPSERKNAATGRTSGTATNRCHGEHTQQHTTKHIFRTKH